MKYIYAISLSFCQVIKFYKSDKRWLVEANRMPYNRIVIIKFNAENRFCRFRTFKYQKMNKRTLKRLGKLWEIETKIYNSCKSVALVGDSFYKYRLVRKIKKQLEEQKRGFLKSTIPYGEIADFIIKNIEAMNYDSLLKGVTHIALKI